MTNQDKDNHIKLNRITLLKQVLYWALMIAGCAVILVMNIHTTLKEDDFLHATIYGTNGEPVNNLLDLLKSLWNHYMWHDGRSANIPDFLFNGLLGKPLFNVCNTLVFGLMAHLVSRFSTGRNSVTVLAMLFAYIIAAWPVPGETMMWVAGSCNYLWAIVASLLFITYLLKHRNAKPGWLLGIVVALLSFLAGAANEGTTMGIFLGLALYYLFNRDKVDRAVVIAMTGYLLGILWLLGSPGMWDRASYDISYESGAFQLFSERCDMLIDRSMRFITPVAAALLGVIALMKNGVKKTLTGSPWAFIYLSLLAFVFAVGMGTLRMYCALCLISFIIMSMVLDYAFKRWQWIAAIVTVACLAVCVYKVPSNVRTVKVYEDFFRQTEQDINQCDSSQAILKVHDFKGYSRFVKRFCLDSWNHFIYESTLVMHYKKDNVQFVSDSIYYRFHEGRFMDDMRPMPFTTSDQGEIVGVYASPGQEYMVVKTNHNSIIHSSQETTMLDADGNPITPQHFFPLLYQGTFYLVFPVLDNKINKIYFPGFGHDREPVEMTRTGPNPEWAFVHQL